MKYDFDLDLETRNSLSLIIERVKPKSVVLEFGPANGRMTKYLKEKLDCRVYAVELDEVAAKDAKEFCQEIIVGDVENYEWFEAYKDKKFDYIIFADVLEHLYYPEKVLKKSIDLLDDNGSVLLSVPNIAHNAIIMELLKDQFTYRNIGLLDNTHIRFFTKNTLDDFIEKSDLKVVYETGTYSHPADTEFAHHYENFPNMNFALQNRKYGEVYQFVIEAKKSLTSQVVDFVKKDKALLYFTTAISFNKNKKLSSEFSLEDQNKIEFLFHNPLQNIKSLRIDPLEHALEINITSLKVNDIDYLSFIAHNGIDDIDGKIIFLHNDPQIYITLPDEIVLHSVVLEYSFFKKIYDVKDRLIQEKEKQIQEKKKQIQEKEKEIQYWRDLADYLRIKNRLKRVIKKIVPNKILKILQYLKHNPKSIKLGFSILKNQGLKALLIKIGKIKHLSEAMLRNSYVYTEPVLTQDITKEIECFKYKPLISIIMPVYNVDVKWLNLAIKSVENQWYDNWELCIVDDKSSNKDTVEYLKNIKNPKIKVKFLEENGNISIASNEALKLAEGEYIALLDNDDELTIDALYEVVKVINETNAEFIYSDEDFLTIDGICVNPHFKPDFSPNLLMSHNYITHLSCFKRELLDKVGMFNSKYDGSQDYDLFLRLTEQANKIEHIPKVLYHWRMLETSTSNNSQVKPEALERGKKVLEDTLERRKIKGKVFKANLDHYFRINYDLLSNPLVSIIIPFKDKPELLKVCVESILQKTTYENFEIIGISNNSNDKSTFREMKRLEKLDKRVHFYEYNVPFNYSKINNYGVNNYAKGKHLILLNNDIEIITPNWIEEMLMYSQQDEIGCVGAKLYYPNDTIQHAGIIIGLGGYAGHSHKHYTRDHSGYFNRLNIVQNLSAVTGACFMVKRDIYDKLNGLDEDNFKIAYNDVDFCLRVLESGYKNIFTPYAEAYHHESISRGYENTKEKEERFQKEKDALYLRHKRILEKGDPYYNKNLTFDREDFSLK